MGLGIVAVKELGFGAICCFKISQALLHLRFQLFLLVIYFSYIFVSI